MRAVKSHKGPKEARAKRETVARPRVPRQYRQNNRQRRKRGGLAHIGAKVQTRCRGSSRQATAGSKWIRAARPPHRRDTIPRQGVLELPVSPSVCGEHWQSRESRTNKWMKVKCLRRHRRHRAYAWGMGLPTTMVRRHAKVYEDDLMRLTEAYQTRNGAGEYSFTTERSTPAIAISAC